jgi:hypothetical protein
MDVKESDGGPSTRGAWETEETLFGQGSPEYEMSELHDGLALLWGQRDPLIWPRASMKRRYSTVPRTSHPPSYISTANCIWCVHLPACNYVTSPLSKLLPSRSSKFSPLKRTGRCSKENTHPPRRNRRL